MVSVLMQVDLFTFSCSCRISISSSTCLYICVKKISEQRCSSLLQKDKTKHLHPSPFHMTDQDILNLPSASNQRSSNFVHIRIQQHNGRKTLTTIQV